jgi:hypothetical protein
LSSSSSDEKKKKKADFLFSIEGNLDVNVPVLNIGKKKVQILSSLDKPKTKI